MNNVAFTSQNRERIAKVLADRLRRVLKERDKAECKQPLSEDGETLQNLARGAVNQVLEEERLQDERLVRITSNVLFADWIPPVGMTDAYRIAVYSAVTRLRALVSVPLDHLATEFGLNPLVLQELLSACEYRITEQRAIRLFDLMRHSKDLAQIFVHLTREACQHIHLETTEGFPQQAFG
jgi:hypothetical protein